MKRLLFFFSILKADGRTGHRPPAMCNPIARVLRVQVHRTFLKVKLSVAEVNFLSCALNGLKLNTLVVNCMCRDVKAGNVYCKTTKRFDVILTRKLWNFLPLPVHCRWSHKRNHSLSLSLSTVSSDYFLVYLLADLFSNPIVVADDYSVPVHDKSALLYVYFRQEDVGMEYGKRKVSQPAYVIFSKADDDNNKGWNKRHPRILDASLVHLFHSSQFLML